MLRYPDKDVTAQIYPFAMFSASTPQQLYREQLHALLHYGNLVITKERPTMEMLNVTTCISSPMYRVAPVPGRRWSPWVALSESLWMIAGQNDVASLLPYNKRIIDFSDNGETFYGAYGERMKEQIPQLIERLRKDPTDRRCYLLIWRPEDLTADTKDPPCNGALMFKLRGNILDMTVINRSNDIHWGLYAVNIPQFGFLQVLLANQLGVEPGLQVHLSNSLHLYMDGPSLEITKRMVDRFGEPLPNIIASEPLPFVSENGHHGKPPKWEDIVDGAAATLTDERYKGIRFFEFASDFLRCYRERRWNFRECRYWHGYYSWVASAEFYLAERGTIDSSGKTISEYLEQGSGDDAGGEFVP